MSFDPGDVGAAVGQTALNLAGSLGLLPRIDPALACNFTVEIDGLIVGGFTEVSGLDVRTQTIRFSEGGRNDYQEQRVNGTVSSANLVLRRGLTTADMLWLWHRDVIAGKFKRRNGSIVLVTGDLLELWRWNFTGAFPVAWTGPAFRADQSVVAFESIELVHQGISKDQGGGALSLGTATAGLVGRL